MTNKEAAEILQSMKPDFPLPKAAQTRRAQNDALDAAIEALKVEPCDDAIGRQAAIDALEKHERSNGHNYSMFVDVVSECAEIIRDLPPTQPERKRGKWIYHIDDIFPAESTMECDQCHAEQPLTCDDEFCPHCGARMEGKGEQ